MVFSLIDCKCSKPAVKGRLLLILAFVFYSGSCTRIDDTPTADIRSGLSEILSRTTGSSVTLNYLTKDNAELYWEYGITSGQYSLKTETIDATADVPGEVVFAGLQQNSKIYYRSRSRAAGSKSAFDTGEEHSFQTWRPAGSSFSFSIEADPHLDYNSDTAAYALSLANILKGNSDFLIDLGDTFMSDKMPNPITQEVITERHLLLRSYFDRICADVPLYLVIGNHEGENGWFYNGTSSCLAVMTALTRLKYYSNPLPDNFYSGNTKSESLVGMRQNYYAWEWGDALFVVLDPYWNTFDKLGWGNTIGKDQYDWFKKTLSGSSAKYKFVFCHNLVGGSGTDARGGTEFAHLFEWGGYNSDGTWGFDTKRQGWGDPIHKIMKDNNVTIFFHGHDHFYGFQQKDGIVYQEVPQPSNRSITNISANDYGYKDGILLPGRGTLKVTVSSSEVKVEYIGSFLPAEETGGKRNVDVIHSYTIK